MSVPGYWSQTLEPPAGTTELTKILRDQSTGKNMDQDLVHHVREFYFQRILF